MTLDEPYNPIYNHWFGEPWPREDYRAPVCEDDRYRIDVPVGQPCLMCSETIEEGDRGVRMGSVYMADDGTPTAALGYVHAECNLRSVTGNHLHVAGMCRHTGDCVDTSTLSYREEAKLVWQLHGN